MAKHIEAKAEPITESKRAWLYRSEDGNEWVLRRFELWGEWRIIKTWTIKDKDENGDGWIQESVLREVIEMQRKGWRVRITLNELWG